jgi:hypothetical protein
VSVLIIEIEWLNWLAALRVIFINNYSLSNLDPTFIISFILPPTIVMMLMLVLAAKLLLKINRDKVVADDAMVIQVRSTGVRVLVPRYGLEGTISVWRENEGEVEGKNPYVYNEELCTLTGIFTNLKCRLFPLTNKWLCKDLSLPSRYLINSR